MNVRRKFVLFSINIIFEASGILILAAAAYIMSLKDQISLEKLKIRKDIEED